MTPIAIQKQIRKHFEFLAARIPKRIQPNEPANGCPDDTIISRHGASKRKGKAQPAAHIGRKP